MIVIPLTNTSPFIKKLRRQARRMGQQIANEQNGLCAICGKPMRMDYLGWYNTHPLRPTIDHIKMVCDGGRNERENLRSVHYKCNQARETEIGIVQHGVPSEDAREALYGEVRQHDLGADGVERSSYGGRCGFWQGFGRVWVGFRRYVGLSGV